MLGFILYLVLIGLVAGFIARALVPGSDPMSVLARCCWASSAHSLAVSSAMC